MIRTYYTIIEHNNLNSFILHSNFCCWLSLLCFLRPKYKCSPCLYILQVKNKLRKNVIQHKRPEVEDMLYMHDWKRRLVENELAVVPDLLLVHMERCKPALSWRYFCWNRESINLRLFPEALPSANKVGIDYFYCLFRGCRLPSTSCLLNSLWIIEVFEPYRDGSACREGAFLIKFDSFP